MTEMIRLSDLSKTFTLHLQGGTTLPVFQNFELAVSGGECVTLSGRSGAGKSTLLRSIYGNYRPQTGRILIRHDGAAVDLMTASPRVVAQIRRRTLGYVSQFLRVIPRVAAINIVSEPLIAQGISMHRARDRAGALLDRLRIPERLWHLPPATFSGGEQQRVNIARVFVADYPIFLLDEPTASLDERNRDTVIELINEAREDGAAIIAILHDPVARQAVTTRTVEISALEKVA